MPAARSELLLHTEYCTFFKTIFTMTAFPDVYARENFLCIIDENHYKLSRNIFCYLTQKLYFHYFSISPTIYGTFFLKFMFLVICKCRIAFHRLQETTRNGKRLDSQSVASG